jgi:hypothetical protein
VTKTFVTNAIEFVGAQAAVLLAGTIIGYVVGWTPEYTAEVIVAAQCALGGWMVRGWIE